MGLNILPRSRTERIVTVRAIAKTVMSRAVMDGAGFLFSGIRHGGAGPRESAVFHFERR